MHGHILMLESKLLASNKHSQTGFALLVKGCTGSLCRSPIDSDVSQQFANIPVHYWRAFLERPETFRADFGHDIIPRLYNSVCIYLENKDVSNRETLLHV